MARLSGHRVSHADLLHYQKIAMSNRTGPEASLTYAQQVKLKREEHMANYRAKQQPVNAANPVELPKPLQRLEAEEKARKVSGGKYAEMTYMEMVAQRRQQHLEAFKQQQPKRLSLAQQAERKRELLQLQDRKAQEKRDEELRLKLEAIANIQDVVAGKNPKPTEDQARIIFRKLNLENYQEHHRAILERHLPELVQWIDSEIRQDVTHFVRLIDSRESEARLKRDKTDFEQRLLASVRTHHAALHRKRRQMLWTNDYGVVKGMDKWIREISEFIDDVVHPPAEILLDYAHYALEVSRWLESRFPLQPVALDVQEMMGSDFELHCADILRDAGWSVHHNGKVGDQGVDLIAELNGIRVALQCKRYSGAVGNTAVQEVFAGQKYEACDVAVVVSNARFTASAIQLAKTLSVLLIDISELSQLDSIVRVVSQGNPS